RSPSPARTAWKHTSIPRKLTAAPLRGGFLLFYMRAGDSFHFAFHPVDFFGKKVYYTVEGG
ncbi:MAG: hypothetical protein IKP74_03940, partial [Clostridia bacterium]|nr:hypothetical protein [Clostridia bacterium]